MTGRLHGKVALISGAARGQGAFEARLFAKEGAAVVLGDVEETECRCVADKINELGGEALTVRLDVTCEEDWIDAISKTLLSYDKLDILVNNAGVYSAVPIENSTTEEFDHILEVNLKGVYLGTKYAIPAMKKSGGGSIINISSTAGLVGNSRGGAYGASKGGVRSLTKFIAIQHAKDFIRANSVHPGPIDTEMIAENISTKCGRAASQSRIPLGRIGTVKDVAWGVVFLASDESSYITGSELVIDGGMTAQ